MAEKLRFDILADIEQPHIRLHSPANIPQALSAAAYFAGNRRGRSGPDRCFPVCAEDPWRGHIDAQQFLYPGASFGGQRQDVSSRVQPFTLAVVLSDRIAVEVYICGGYAE